MPAGFVSTPFGYQDLDCHKTVTKGNFIVIATACIGRDATNGLRGRGQIRRALSGRVLLNHGALTVRERGVFGSRATQFLLDRVEADTHFRVRD